MTVMPPPRPATHQSFYIERPLPLELTALLLHGCNAERLVSDEGK
jgi:hypothetical protein